MISSLVYCGVRNYEYLYSTKDLLSKKTCLRFAEEDVLGQKPYNETCPRSSYLPQVGMPLAQKDTDNDIFFIFKFYPISGKEKSCPPVEITISRQTGEAWVDVEK